ncbi:shikimate dehydrogenase [Streptomyces sp. NPDC005930]|uniref:shikimate dehydrogenase n=1 Tax=Streptomyces sp. NPDC005930 TaxID=3364736 RepID=UPI0036B16F4C
MTQHSYLFGCVGSGNSGLLGFQLHEREADRHGLRYLCRRVHGGRRITHEKDLSALLRMCRGFGYSGLSIAAPYRQLAAEQVDDMSEAAARRGFLDLVLFAEDGRMAGHSTDVDSCAAAFARGLPDRPLGRVLQLGADGVGNALAHALRDQGAEHLSVVDPDLDRAETLVARLNAYAGGEWAEPFPVDALRHLLGQANGLVNAYCPTAHGPDLTAALVEVLRPDLWIFDFCYRPIRTALLREGSARGCRVVHGGGVLVNEAARAFQLVTGLSPHTARMFADFADLTAGPQAHT